MRRALMLSILCLSTPTLAERPMWGGLGYMTQGWVIGDPSGVSESMGEDLAPGTGLVLGGGGFGLLAGRVIIGGQGYTVQGLDGGSLAADATYSGGGGGFHVGYALVNDGHQIIFPFVGAVGHGGELKVRNGTNPARIGGIDLLPGEARGFSGGGYSLDIGAALFHLPWREHGGGPAIGGHMGGWIPVARGDWEAVGGGTATNVTGAPAGLYFRLNVGGGGASEG